MIVIQDSKKYKLSDITAKNTGIYIKIIIKISS